MRAIECTSFRGDRNTWLRVGFFRGWTQGPAIARIAAFYLTLNKRLVGSGMSTVRYFDVLNPNPFPELLEADEVRHDINPTVKGSKVRREEVTDQEGKMEVPKGRTDLDQAQRKEGQRILLENEVRRSETVLSEIKDLIYSQ